MTFKDSLFIASQHLIPQHTISRVAGRLANCRQPAVKKRFISWFAKRYGVDMSEAERPNLEDYECFNDFFTRAMKADARPIDNGEESIVCPADGTISQLGSINEGRIFQAKGQSYSTLELLGGDPALAEEFADGSFATVYLSPKDYHRVHMPMTGTLRQMVAVPGQLFSVNEVTARHVPRLFARNERVVCIFDTEIGPMAVVLVGAVIVAGIETVWAGEQAPIGRRVSTTYYGDAAPASIKLDKGAEMGRFKLGSTAIVLFGRDKVHWSEQFSAGTPTRMGEALGQRA
ncbi:archaetidylserine decarboxylase [Gilvimarinus sp. DA14]|uniref:archaetidylserine decarboxylase n=1 Tax=Gilvimarinus sp. DA14 TaxID=2956798 RepID=UPI0020B72358|nr:archaetidylserine decarboxylase [Gilvimarinus sp. DA14]UTF61651.1 archaetidylserine decarboxylase [Gilvimarinus sp. DA14]